MNILKYILRTLFLFFLILFMSKNVNIFDLELFKNIRKENIYAFLDNQIIEFITLKNVDLISNTIYLFMQIFILYAGVFIIVLLNSIVNNRFFFIQIIIKIYFFFLDKIIHLNFKKCLDLFIFTIPFIHLFIQHEHFSIFVIISILYWYVKLLKAFFTYWSVKFLRKWRELSNALISFFKRSEQSFYYKWTLYNSVLSISIGLPAIYNLHQVTIKNISFLNWFSQLYSLSAFLLIFIMIFILFIKFEYYQAKKSKELIKEIKINFLNSKSKEKLLQHINSSIAIFQSTSKYEWMLQRGILIKNRNHFNLISSISYVFIVLLIIFFSTITTALNSKQDDQPIFIFELETIDIKMLIFFILLIGFRLLLRSFEILKGFLDDALSSANKLSTLSGNERIKLMLNSLFEVVILSFGLKILYLLFKTTETITVSSSHLKDGIILLYDTWAIQLFNVSFAKDFDLFLATIHVIQISVAACLILLCISVYSGKNEKGIIYEIIRENNLLSFKEILIKNNSRFERILAKEASLECFKNSWETGELSIDCFNEIQNSYKELLDNEKHCQEQKDYIIKAYDNLQAIKQYSSTKKNNIKHNINFILLIVIIILLLVNIILHLK